MPSIRSHPAHDAKPARSRRKSVLRVPQGASVVSATGDRKRFGDSFKRWQRTKAFHIVSDAAGGGVVDELRRSRDAGYF